MRRAILAAVAPAASWWPRPVWIGVSVAATLITGVLIGRHLPQEQAGPGGPVIAGEPSTVEPARRQVQFDTPGGTRIIWVIDPDFDL